MRSLYEEFRMALKDIEMRLFYKNVLPPCYPFTVRFLISKNFLFHAYVIKEVYCPNLTFLGTAAWVLRWWVDQLLLHYIIRNNLLNFITWNVLFVSDNIKMYFRYKLSDFERDITWHDYIFRRWRHRRRIRVIDVVLNGFMYFLIWSNWILSTKKC